MRDADQVLVVDDERGIRELVCAYLQKQGLRAAMEKCAKAGQPKRRPACR